jgi:hypothetical protein
MWLVIEAGSKEDRDAYDRREDRSRAALEALGIDPSCNPGVQGKNLEYGQDDADENDDDDDDDASASDDDGPAVTLEDSSDDDGPVVRKGKGKGSGGGPKKRVLTKQGKPVNTTRSNSKSASNRTQWVTAGKTDGNKASIGTKRGKGSKKASPPPEPSCYRCCEDGHGPDECPYRSEDDDIEDDDDDATAEDSD